jgi:hypothetical protein
MLLVLKSHSSEISIFIILPLDLSSITPDSLQNTSQKNNSLLEFIPMHSLEEREWEIQRLFYVYMR